MTAGEVNSRATTTSRKLGGSVRIRRTAESVTLAQLAERTGLSQSFLSQLENGRTNTSLRSLQRIADALGTTATVLLADSDDDEPVARREDDVLAVAEGTSSAARSLVHGKRQLRALEFTGETHDDREFVHAHDELLYVADGSVEVRLRHKRAEDIVELHGGDAVYIDADVPHRWRALSPDARVVVMSVADDMVVRRSTRPPR